MTGENQQKLVDIWLVTAGVIAIFHSAIIGAIAGPKLSADLTIVEALFLIIFLLCGSMFVLLMFAKPAKDEALLARTRTWFLELLFAGGTIWSGAVIFGRPIALGATLFSWWYVTLFLLGFGERALVRLKQEQEK